MQIDLAVDRSELDRLTEAVEAFCEANAAPPEAIIHLTLVLEELFTNIVAYGYKGRHDGGRPIHVALERGDGRIVVEISDGGIEFDPLAAPPPDLDLDLEDRPIGGLGIHFMRTIMSDLVYTRRDGRNHLRFSKIWASQEPTS